MNNQAFLGCLKQSFVRFLQTHSRSNEKLKVLHGAIAQDLANRLGNEYAVQSLGYGNEKEGIISGRYMNKNVDIAIFCNQQAVAGIGVKFVMQNYAQNANNYFENMLGETANIQSKNVPYFQILIVPNRLPYYKNTGVFSKWETFGAHHIAKYRVLSHDDNVAWVHTPAKTLLYVIELPEIRQPENKDDYVRQYLALHENNQLNFRHFACVEQFGNGLIYNDYELFMRKVAHRILSE